MTKHEIVIITGGSFQGKSLISLSLASRLGYSGVISTDAIRNVLKVLYPEKSYLGTSTYLLPPEDLNRQRNDVSDVIKEIICIYENRGESIIIEGMHFSSDFFSWAKEKNFCRITLDNQLAFEQRIVFKGKIRSRLRVISDESQDTISIMVNKENVKTTAYYQHRDRIEEIHQHILVHSEEQDFHIIRFNELNEAINGAFAHINQWFAFK